MHARRLSVHLLLVLGMILAATPASAHDGDHAGPGSAGPDQHSQNMKLKSNVPTTGPTNSDLAFDGKLAYAGNYGGFRVIDVSDPDAPVVRSTFTCPGAQGDVSVYGGLLFQSVDGPRSNDTCVSQPVQASTPGMFEGVRIFDVRNPAAPVHVASVPTDCGSHTNTIVPDGDRVFVYVSSYPIGNAALGPNCVRREDGGGHSKISIIEVPLSDPTAATVSPYMLDPGTEWATYLGSFTMQACHDISVFVELGLAAAACLSEAQVWDISDPAQPQFMWRYDNPAVQTANIDLFHSAAFSWDGKVVAFGDESGGGGAARCTDPDDQQGRIWFLDLATGQELASYKVPRSVSGTCTMHNFNFIPRRDGKKVLVSSAYTGGTTVVDVDALIGGASAAAAEIGHYVPSGASTWSSYWHDGFIYANDIRRGMDIMLLSDKARAGAVKLGLNNPQTQMKVIRP